MPKIFSFTKIYYFQTFIYRETAEGIHAVISNNLYIYIIHTDHLNLPSPSTAHHQEKLQETVLLSVVHPS